MAIIKNTPLRKIINLKIIIIMATMAIIKVPEIIKIVMESYTDLDSTIARNNNFSKNNNRMSKTIINKKF